MLVSLPLADENGLVGFNPGSALLVLIIFMFVVIVLYKTAWKHVLAGLKSREERIRKEESMGSSKLRAVTAGTLAEYQTLDLERQTAEKQYTEAVALRTQAQLTARNQQSYLALFVAPTMPQTSLYPDRPKSIVAVFLAAAAAWFAGMLIVYALRDHLM